jgi:hypothetical protein
VPLQLRSGDRVQLAGERQDCAAEIRCAAVAVTVPSLLPVAGVATGSPPGCRSTPVRRIVNVVGDDADARRRLRSSRR